ncbi:pT repeat family protein [Firmicutes bacterium CAG:137]|nr:pT repeat family protein [Firmicutes bacterium CAG:137]
MKTGKQFLALTLGLLLVLGLFAGCQQEKAPATEPSTEPVTEAPTEAPTEEPTEAPTEATEPATEPEDAVTNVFLQEPEGFFVDTTTGFLRAPGFPDDMSYISVIPTPQNTAVLDMSAEQYEAAMKLSLAAMGQDAEATVESVEKTEVDGYPTVKSVSQLTMSGATFYITDYQIVASQNYSITFADATADGAWADAFDQAAASIDLLKEGETATADFSDLAKYDLSCGLSLSAMDGLAEVETEEESGYDGYMESNDVLFFAVHDTKEELLEAGYSKLSLEQYGRLVSEAYELDAFSTDNLGNLYVTDTDTNDSGEIFYYFTVVQGTDGFWTCYFACYNDLMPYYVSAFSIWASSITAP